MNERKEVAEIKETDEAKEYAGNIAAFFDLDGTLAALPSLERGFFRMLRYQRAIGAKNYFLWLREALRLLPRGISAILHANKMYLRDVQILDERGEGDGNFSSSHKDGHRAQGQAPAPSSRRGRCNPRLPVPGFFPQAIERVAWHGKQGHAIVLVSGTLEPLARGAARALEAELAARGIAVAIRVRATRLEERDGKGTGRVLGEAMFGEAKARAAKQLAEEMRFDLAACYAYGDGINDEQMLSVVGKPSAVNPSQELLRIAKARNWPVLHWNEAISQTQWRRERREEKQRKEEKPASESRLRRQSRETQKQLRCGEPCA